MRHAAEQSVEEARASWLKRRDRVTSSFVECLGDRPDWGDLDGRVRRRSESSEYVAEWVSFDAEPGEVITGLLTWPKDASAPFPVVLAHHGFWGDKERMVLGEDASGPGDGAIPLWQLTRSGMAVMAIDGRAHGERGASDYVLPWRHEGKRTVPRPDRLEDRLGYREAVWEDYEWANRAALIDGSSIAALETWDAVRALDYLSTRPEIDIERVGSFGHSRGGDVAWYVALADRRVRAVCTSGCMQPFEACLEFRRDKGAIAWIPGIRSHASREELVAAVAPRPLLALEGEEDHAPEGEQPMWDALTEAYAVLGVPERFAYEHWPGGHGEFLKQPAGFQRIAEWFSRWL